MAGWSLPYSLGMSNNTNSDPAANAAYAARSAAADAYAAYLTRTASDVRANYDGGDCTYAAAYASAYAAAYASFYAAYIDADAAHAAYLVRTNDAADVACSAGYSAAYAAYDAKLKSQ